MQIIKKKTKMLQTIIFLFACVVQTKEFSEQIRECSQWCTCEDSVIHCEGGGIPQMERNITRFQLKNAQPPILDLSHSIITRLQHLVSLNIDAAGLRSIQPKTLGLIDHLEELSLTNNNITVIDNYTFANCSSLINLMLDNNNIKIIKDGAFVPLQHLQKLSLSQNQLSTLPTFLPPQIQQLSVHHNILHEAPQFHLPNLTSLNLCYNLITHIDPKEMNFINMKKICLGGSKFNPNNKVITKEHFPVLESLHLKGFPNYDLVINDNTLMDIKDMSTTSLHALELDLCSISSLHAFREMNNLHTLKLMNVTLIATRMSPTKFVLPPIPILDFSGSPGLAQSFLRSAISKPMTSVEILRMRGCRITTFPLSVKEQLPNITHLDLSHNPINCTCDLAWISDHVREGKLTIENEKYTLCANPKHLQGITLLTATLCPFGGTLATETTPKSTVTSTKIFKTHATTPVSFIITSSSHAFPEESTKKSGKPDGRSLPTSKPIEETSGLSTKHLVFVIVGSIVAFILAAYILLMLGNYLLNCYRARQFTPGDVTYSSQQRLTLHSL